MASQTIEERVDVVEQRVTALNALPARVDALSTQIVDLRGEMRTEFSASRAEMHAEFSTVRGEARSEFAASRGEMQSEFLAIRGGERDAETPSLCSLKNDIGDLRDTLRKEIQENGDRVMGQVRVLHEDLYGNADQVAANEVRCQRAEGERRKERVQQDAETPAQPCTERCAEPDCNEACRVHPLP